MSSLNFSWGVEGEYFKWFPGVVNKEFGKVPSNSLQSKPSGQFFLHKTKKGWLPASVHIGFFHYSKGGVKIYGTEFYVFLGVERILCK